MPDQNYAAFKEWEPVVDALTAGRQTLILRKGGIAENRDGFAASHRQFWLLPTRFHAQNGKLKPGEWSKPPPLEKSTNPNTAILSAYAELVEHRFLTEWAKVETLLPHHIWTNTTVHERFAWSKPSGIHLLIVRIHKLDTPVSVKLTAAQSGCKSWVTLPLHPRDYSSVPTLEPHAFESQINLIRRYL